tara:strand:- start:1757 stop:2542 length:786 start_codon:yes stop_codon:yes gene_type:complete
MTDYFLSFLLGLIQGLTEFLPISSSAHLLFPTLIFGTNDLGLSFDIAVHAGTLIAVIFFFRNEIKCMLKSITTSDTSLSDYRKLTYMLIIATIPIVLAGLGFSDFIEDRIFNVSSIAIANLIFAIILLVVFLNRKENLSIFEITFKAALLIGFFQCFALIPGASRSGMAITGALLIGLNLKDASKFTFLLSIPTIAGALIFLLVDFNQINFDYLNMLIGFVVSTIVAFFTIKYFLAFVERIGMVPFVIYRVILGLMLLIIF